VAKDVAGWILASLTLIGSSALLGMALLFLSQKGNLHLGIIWLGLFSLFLIWEIRRFFEAGLYRFYKLSFVSLLVILFVADSALGLAFFESGEAQKFENQLQRVTVYREAESVLGRAFNSQSKEGVNNEPKGQIKREGQEQFENIQDEDKEDGQKEIHSKTENKEVISGESASGEGRLGNVLEKESEKDSASEIKDEEDDEGDASGEQQDVVVDEVDDESDSASGSTEKEVEEIKVDEPEEDSEGEVKGVAEEKEEVASEEDDSSPDKEDEEIEGD
jgi:hypothetical protein